MSLTVLHLMAHLVPCICECLQGRQVCMRRVGNDAMKTRSTRLERSRLEELLELLELEFEVEVEFVVLAGLLSPRPSDSVNAFAC